MPGDSVVALALASVFVFIGYNRFETDLFETVEESLRF
jgi:hypothetical protein